MSDRIYNKQRESLVQALIEEKIICSPQVTRAMRKVPREMFVPENVKTRAYSDMPLPIGFNQTISAPHMVAMMAEALELKVGQKILEVGSGSGYHAAVLAEIVAPRDVEGGGYVYTIEIVLGLSEFAKTNLQTTGYADRVMVIRGDGSIGYQKYAPYDRILVTAAAPKILQFLVDQLKVGGILVLPVGNTFFYQELIKVEKLSEDKVLRRSLHKVAFVPLRGKYGWKG